MHWRASYYSEGTTSALWLLGWWTLLDWYETGRRGSLLALSACVAWCTITRPLTAVAFAAPTAAVVLWRCYTKRTWRDLGLALALGVVILGVIPLWSARTTVDWGTTPYMLYARMYFPMKLDTDLPARALPPDMQRWVAPLKDLVHSHTLNAIPTELVERVRQIGVDMWHGWRLLFLPFALIGLVALPAAGVYALVTAGVLVLVHLTIAHYPSWSLYYIEAQPVLAFLTALGLGLAAIRVRGWLGSSLTRAGAGLLCAAALGLACLDLRAIHGTLRNRQGYFRAFADLVDQIPDSQAIVFVRYSPYHNVNGSLITNEPDLDRARAWIVYDRGSDNARLLAVAPTRVPYLYDEATNTLTRLPPGGSSP